MSKTQAPQLERDESPDARLVRELAGVLNDTGLSEIEVERADIKIRVAKTFVAAPIAMTAAAAPAAHAPPPAAAPTPEPAAAPTPAAKGTAVKSPMVGTVYLQPAPGAAPFARVGDKVSEGQTLLLIEAMKTMNPIPAPCAGVLLELGVADGQPVEYGERLAVIG